MKNFFKDWYKWFVKLFKKDKTLTNEIKLSDIFNKTKRIGRGQAFKNNCKRTRGRKLQYVDNKLIRHYQDA